MFADSLLSQVFHYIFIILLQGQVVATNTLSGNVPWIVPFMPHETLVKKRESANSENGYCNPMLKIVVYQKALPICYLIC